MATDTDDRETPEMGEETTAETTVRETTRRPATARRDAEPAEDADADADEEKARLRAALAKANKEAKDRRLRLDELERAEEDRRREKMTEAERIAQARKDAEHRAAESESRAARAEAALLSERVNLAVERAAQQVGFEYPEDVPKLIDRDRIGVDEAGDIDRKTVRDAVDRLAKDRPGLLTARRGGGTPPRDQGRFGGGHPGAAGAGGPRGAGGRAIDPYEQELIDMGRGGRM